MTAETAGKTEGATAAARHAGPFTRVKRYLPKTLFGRALVIIVTPLLLMHAISTFVFYDRHWSTMTRRLADSVAGNVGLVVEMLEPAPDTYRLVRANRIAEQHLAMTLAFQPDRMIAASAQRPPADRGERTLRAAIAARLDRPFTVNSSSVEREVQIQVQFHNGVLRIATHHKRLYSSTTYIFLMWMVGSSLVLFAIAIIFMRNQIRPIRRLAVAARAFGLGREVGDFRPEGASEVRQAAEAFQQMRERIRSQIAQRTEMLAGVSHDLRTPITRMKLQLAMLEGPSEIGELRDDLTDMEQMIEAYLAFARGEGTEAPVETDLSTLVLDIVAAENRGDDRIRIAGPVPERLVLPVRPRALRRALSNLLANAKRYAGTVTVSILPGREQVEVLVEDDGPGIPPEYREAVFKPFYRLEASRNRATGGTGLGLTIARDIARGHGGDLELQAAPAGGLRARLRLPL